MANYLGGDKLLATEQHSTGNSGPRFANYKREAEAPYNGVRVGILYKNTADPAPTFEAYVASTDTGLRNTNQNLFAPMSGGAAVNAVVTGADTPGWHRVTWGGANSVTPPLVPGVGQKVAGVVFSDVIPLNSKARTDVPGARPMTVAKVNQLAAGAGYVGGVGRTAWNLARDQYFYREEVNQSSSSADPAVYPNGTVNTTYLNQPEPIAIWLEYQYTVPVRNFLVTGDSRSSAAACKYNFDTWSRRAVKMLSTPQLPCTLTNAAGSGYSQTEFLAIATAMINAGWQGTDVILPAFSQNGFNDGSAGFIARNRVFLDLCISKGFKIYMTTDYGIGYPVGQAAETGRQECIAEARRLASIGQVTLIDADGLLTNYADSPNNPNLKPQFNTAVVANGVEGAPGSGDGNHMGSWGHMTLGKSVATTIGATTILPSSPGAPTIGTVTAGVGSASVPWTPPADNNGSAIIDCTITAQPVGATGTTGQVIATGTTSPIPLTGLVAGTAYTAFARVRNSVDSGGASVASNTFTPTAAPVADTTAPVMVGDIEITNITTSGATLSCQAATDAVGVAGYEYSINGGTNYTLIANAGRSVVVSGRPAGTTHDVRMRAFDAAGNRATEPLAKSFKTLDEQPPVQNGVVASTVAESRRVAFPGGTRVVPFDSRPTVRTPNAPYLELGRWWSEKHPLDERYWVADITIALAERNTTATSVVALVAGVVVLEQPVVQGKLIPVKLGGFNAAIGASNFCTLRITLANGERIDRTIYFKQQVGVHLLDKDPDEQSFYVGDIGNDLVDSNTTATQVTALPVGVEELVPAVIQGPLILVKLGGMDTLPAGANYCDFRIDCANTERFHRTIQFNRVDN